MANILRRNISLTIIAIGILIWYCGCKKYKLEHIVTPFAGLYKVSGFYGRTGILGVRIDTLPGDTSRYYFDTTIVDRAYTDTIIILSIINDTALGIWGQECYYSPGGGRAIYFQSVNNTIYFSQGVTITKSSPDSIYITIFEEVNPALSYETALKGTKL